MQEHSPPTFVGYLCAPQAHTKTRTTDATQFRMKSMQFSALALRIAFVVLLTVHLYITYSYLHI